MPKAPALPEIEVTPLLDHADTPETEKKGYSNRLLSLRITEHISTHIDAPIHFYEKGKTIDAIPLENFYLIDTRVLHLTKKEYETIEVDDIRQAEKVSGKIKPGEFIILNTGFDAYWGTEKYLKNPFLSLTAATYLTSKGICALGVDAFSVDDVRRPERPIHLEFLKNNDILIIESVGNLHKIPSSRFKSIFFPLKIKEGSGSPIRLVGVFE